MLLMLLLFLLLLLLLLLLLSLLFIPEIYLSSWNRVSNSWDIADIKFLCWVVCKVIFLSDPSYVRLSWFWVVKKCLKTHWLELFPFCDKSNIPPLMRITSNQLWPVNIKEASTLKTAHLLQKTQERRLCSAPRLWCWSHSWWSSTTWQRPVKVSLTIFTTTTNTNTTTTTTTDTPTTTTTCFPIVKE